MTSRGHAIFGLDGCQPDARLRQGLFKVDTVQGSPPLPLDSRLRGNDEIGPVSPESQLCKGPGVKAMGRDQRLVEILAGGLFFGVSL